MWVKRLNLRIADLQKTIPPTIRATEHTQLRCVVILLGSSTPSPDTLLPPEQSCTTTLHSSLSQTPLRAFSAASHPLPCSLFHLESPQYTPRVSPPQQLLQNFSCPSYGRSHHCKTHFYHSPNPALVAYCSSLEVGDLLPVQSLVSRAPGLAKSLAMRREVLQSKWPCVLLLQPTDPLMSLEMTTAWGGTGLGAGRGEQRAQESLAEQEGKSLARWGSGFPAVTLLSLTAAGTQSPV